jgi:hypothetical protein
MACVRPTSTPNPDAMKFELDIALPERIHAKHGDDVEDLFTRALLSVDGVASVFGVNDFVTVTRSAGADWDPIIHAVERAAATHLPTCPGRPSTEAAERARALLRDAARGPAVTKVDIRVHPRRSRDS